MIRVLSFNNIMRLLRKVEEHYNETLILELKSDHSGCIKSSITYDIYKEWSDLESFNDLVKEYCYVRPNRPTK